MPTPAFGDAGRGLGGGKHPAMAGALRPTLKRSRQPRGRISRRSEPDPSTFLAHRDDNLPTDILIAAAFGPIPADRVERGGRTGEPADPFSKGRHQALEKHGCFLSHHALSELPAEP